MTKRRRAETSGDSLADRLQLGERLREQREWLGLSQELVAEKMDIPRSSVSELERGNRSVTAIELKRFATLYGCTVSWLLQEAAEEQDVPDETFRLLRRVTMRLFAEDREQVLRFARFLRQVTRPALPEEDQAPNVEAPAEESDVFEEVAKWS